MNKIDIQTADGVCPACVFRPAGSGPWPAAIVYMDIHGMRPAIQDVAGKLASSGYFVLLPDLFWRLGAHAPIDPREMATDPDKVAAQREVHRVAAPLPKVMADTRAFLDFLAAQPDVQAGPVGVTGYCFGGRLAIAAAGTYPDEVAAAAAYHPGGLATDDATSPHLLAPKIKARLYVGAAMEDRSLPEEMKERLGRALADAGVEHRIETYAAKHGWVLRDMPVYDEAATARHWQTLTALFDAALKR